MEGAAGLTVLQHRQQLAVVNKECGDVLLMRMNTALIRNQAIMFTMVRGC